MAKIAHSDWKIAMRESGEHVRYKPYFNYITEVFITGR